MTSSEHAVVDQWHRGAREDTLLKISSLSHYHPPHLYLWNLIFSNTASFFLVFFSYKLESLTLTGTYNWGCLWTSLTMLTCYHRASESAIPVGFGGVVTKQVSLSIKVLRWRGLYPPPFRISFHTGRGSAGGITLNKQTFKHKVKWLCPPLVIYHGILNLMVCSDLALIEHSVKSQQCIWVWTQVRDIFVRWIIGVTDHVCHLSVMFLPTQVNCSGWVDL